MIAEEFKIALSEDHIESMRTELYARFQAELQPIPGIVDMLAGLTLPHCVASSSQPERIRLSLTKTGLIGFFEPNIFSATMVRKGKPEPDLFLHAAKSMGFAPADCLVVEDSPAGIQAAHSAGMKVFARDARVMSIDSDLASTSGLEGGIAAVDQMRALNAGVAEANMMLIGEAYAAMGYNAWCSTFCPFFNWQVMRRIAVGQQERLEAIHAKDGWLSEGHGLDLTFLATAANFETRTNGATHMGNDDANTFDAVAHLKIIDV